MNTPPAHRSLDASTQPAHMDTTTLSGINYNHDDTMLTTSATRTLVGLENLPLECIQVILEHLSDDCLALHSLLVMNRAWFQMVIPFLYRSPMVLIDATWPKLSPYSQVLKKELPTPVEPPTANSQGSQDVDSNEITTAGQQTQRNGRSTFQSDVSGRRTSAASLTGPGGGVGYSPRTPSRSSSRSSTRSMDAFHHGRNEAVHQKDQRERLVKRKKMQVLWVLLNCTLSEKERSELKQARKELQEEEIAAGSLETSSTSAMSIKEGGVNQGAEEEHSRTTRKPSRCGVVPIQHSTSTLLALELSHILDIDVDYFQPMVDYLSYYTHYFHPGLRFTIWKLFPNIDDSFTIEWRLISHCPARIRELFLETVQMQDLIPLVSRLETLHRIRTCHEGWDVQGSVEFIRKHNELFGTVRMLELEAYLPENHDTVMDPDLSRLIAQIDHLSVLELAGFTHLQADLEPIPRGNLKVLRLNCGSLNPRIPDFLTAEQQQQQQQQHQQLLLPQPVGDTEETARLTRMNISTFLSQCRQLEELHLKSVDENLLEWAVLERRSFQSSAETTPSHSPSPLSAIHTPAPALVPLKVIELSGTDSEHIAMTISHAAMAFQDTLEVIKANSYSYQSNRSLTSLSWSSPMPRLRVLKIVGRANLPFDFRSLQHCPALRILDLSKYSGMRSCSESLLLNLKYLTQLEYLGLSSFDHLTDATLRTILGCMPGLKHLRLAIGDSPIPTSSYAVSGVAPNRNLGSTGNSYAGMGEGIQRPPLTTTQSPLPSLANGPSSSSGVNPEPPLPAGMTHMIVGEIQPQQPSYQSHAHSHYAYHPPSVSPLTASSASMSSASVSGSGSGGVSGTVAPANPQGIRQTSFSPAMLDLQDFIPQSSRASARSSSVSSASSVSTSAAVPSSSIPLSLPPASLPQGYPLPMMDRFHLENNYLSLEGILDAIDGFSDTKNQLEKLSIVLGKLDFEDHYYRLEQYNQLHSGLEITVYRYAHAV